MSLRRGKTPVVQFFARGAKLAEMHPIVPAAKAMPQWYREQPSFTKERRFPHLRLRDDVTIKGCPGVGDYLGSGYIIPLWADFIMASNEAGFQWEATTSAEHVAFFKPDTWNHFPRPNGTHEWVLKLISPWRIQTPKGWSILLVQPWYHQNPHWTVFPGIIEADRCPALNLVAMWNAPFGEPVLMKAGTPLLHVIPFRRDKFDYAIHQDHHEFDALNGNGIGAVGGIRLAPGAYREERNVVTSRPE
jgi:hypothetical protein